MKPLWEYKGTKIRSIKDTPSNAIGFIYLIEFEDGSKYIGKKNLFSFRKLTPLKSGKLRPDSTGLYYRIKGGHREYYELVKRESDFMTYNGSSQYCKGRTPIKRTILEYAYNNYQLTYLEVVYLCNNRVLENMEYLNENILGKFFRGEALNGSISNITFESIKE